MSPHLQELITYIKNEIARGVDHVYLKQHLIAHQWPEQDVELAYHHATQSSQPERTHVHSDDTDETLGIITDSKLKVFKSVVAVWGMFGKKPLLYMAVTISSFIFVLVSLFAIEVGTGPLGFLLLGAILSGSAVVMFLILAIVLLLGSIIVYGMIFPVILTLTVTILEESRRKHTQSLFDALKRGLKGLPRAVAGSILLMFAVIVPYIIALFTIFYLRIGAYGNQGVAVFSLIVALAAPIAVILILLRYSLVPYVLMLEKQVTFRRSFRRSKELLNGRSQWFLFKAFVLYVLVVLIIGILTDSQQTNDTEYSPLALVFMLLTVFAFQTSIGLFYLLHQNRVYNLAYKS